jgi:hypothetical protein
MKMKNIFCFQSEAIRISKSNTCQGFSPYAFPCLSLIDISSFRLCLHRPFIFLSLFLSQISTYVSFKLCFSVFSYFSFFDCRSFSENNLFSIFLKKVLNHFFFSLSPLRKQKLNSNLNDFNFRVKVIV